MIVIIIGLYAGIIWLLFFKLKLVEPNAKSYTAAAIIGVVVIGLILKLTGVPGITVFAFALACGGSPQEAPSPAVPAGQAAGPGVATAPDGVSIAYTVSGEGSPALVFVHGWMCDQTYWTAQAASFSTTHTVVTIDLAGHGESGMEREGWPLIAFGADVEAVVEGLDLDRVILIGHSMGGPVVLEAARLMLERVIGVVGVDTLQDADFKYDP